jgi:hypothetical protein
MDRHGKPDRALLAALIRSAARPLGGETRALDRLVRRCWPGGADRTEPAGLAWVRGWGPSRTTVRLPDCACAAGRCGTCN